MGVLDTLSHGWNAFVNREDFARPRYEVGASYGARPDMSRYRVANDKSIISAIYARISLDVAAVDIRHVRLDKYDRFLENIDSGLHNCLTLETNIDQSARAFLQDVVLSMFDQGHIALVPIDVSDNPITTGGFDILTMRVGRITQWMPRHVRVDVYNDRTGRHEELTLEKRVVAIVTNPFYMIMNETNSTLQRLQRKLGLLDIVDEQSSSGKLDMIIQLPYTIRSETRREQANQRRKDIEMQLKGSQYGIAYTDGTEKITQLNRPAENNLLKQVEYLTEMVYSQLGLTKEIMDGTADEKTMLNYITRVIEPIVAALVEEIKRKFLTKTARTQKQSIEYFRDPFRLVPMSVFAELVDKLTRNEVISSNEARQVVGLAPSQDPKADQLVNSNMPQLATGVGAPVVSGEVVSSVDDVDNVAEETGVFDEVNGVLDDVFNELGVTE